MINASLQAESGSMVGTLIMMALVFVAFYFFLIRPQKKRDKETQAMRSNIEVGDEVVTIGGILGIVVSIKDDTLVLETGSDRSKIRILRSAIQQNLTYRPNA